MKGAVAVLSIAVLALMTFGLVMLTSTSSFYAYTHYGDAFYYAKRQTLWLGLGLAAGLLTARLDYHRYRKYAWPLFMTAAVMLLGVLIFGRRVNGALRWFDFGPISFQPSEFAKYGLVVFLAYWLEKAQRPRPGQFRRRIQHAGWGIFAPLAFTIGLAVLLLKEPDFGTALLLGIVALLLMWVGGSSGRWLGGIVTAGVAGIAAFLVAIFQYGMFQGIYQVQRILQWWRGGDLEGINYQQGMAKLAFGSGGLQGLGLGDSRMKMAYLPEAHTDFIFPIVGEELGLIATLAVVIVFCLVVVCGILLLTRAPDLFGMLLGAGIVTVIGLQAIINIAVVTNTIPNKGMVLPLISYGGSNLVMTLAALGVLCNIFRQSQSHTAEALALPPAL